MNRRHFLKHVAASAAMAVPAYQFLQTINANAQQIRRNNKRLIIMWMGGGPATIDIWDLKPGRPTGGEFRPINTSAPGVQISEHMPITARQMDKLAIVRSLQTREGSHQRGTQLMHTGFTPNPAIDFPSINAVVAHEAPNLEGFQGISLPGNVSVGGARGGGGFLGMSYAPFNVQNPGRMPENIESPRDLGSGAARIARARRRQRMFYTLEDMFRRGRAPHLNSEKERATFGDASKSHQEVYGKAFSLTVSSEGRVFDIANEPATVRDAYGPSNFGRSALLARRLLESGVSAVEISLGGWDTHNQNFNRLSTNQLPTLDRGMGNLVRELSERGLWDSTVLLWMGDFGRTPRINQNVGRDHWPRCWSVVVGGGAIRGGRVHGSTNRDGTAVADNGEPVTVSDVFATVYRGLGIDPSTQVRDAIGRPFNITGQFNGSPIGSLFS